MIAEINDTIGNATWERDETPLEVFSQSEVQKVNVLVSLLEPFERAIVLIQTLNSDSARLLILISKR